jgi:U3 small nucleolar RNA-associated protein 6
VRYAAYEQNLETLKKKRLKRLAVKNFGYNGQRRTFFIFERATRRFPGELRLWVQYLDYARAAKAHKRVGKILTAVLRLHPTNSDLWVVAAQYSAYSQGEFGAARSYLQRGLRFCPKEKHLWLEYLRLEMQFLAKTVQNLEDLGFKETSVEDAVNDTTSDDRNYNPVLSRAVGSDSDQAAQASRAVSSDESALASMASTPALTGAIPIAIFDSAMKEFDANSPLAEQMFDIVASFPGLMCCQKILKHILSALGRQLPATANWAMCSFKCPLVGVMPTSPKFPMALRHALQLLRASIVQQRRTQTKYEIADRAALTLLPMTIDPEVDLEIRKVITSALRQIVRVLGSGSRLAKVLEKLQTEDRLDEARVLLKLGLMEDATSKVLHQKYMELEGPENREVVEEEPMEHQQPGELEYSTMKTKKKIRNPA